MGKATGPGKTLDLPRRGFERVRAKALLFNYDIEGDALKPEHVRWLTDNVLPLKATANLQVRLRGLASRSGSDWYNKQLSEKRVKRVQEFLSGHGIVLSQVSSVATGEEDAALAGDADGTEDEKFRGVIVAAVIAARAQVPRFEKLFAHEELNGFDSTTNPRWVMVKSQDFFRDVRLRNAGGFDIVSRKPGTVVPVNPLTNAVLGRITSDDQVIRLRAGLPGTARIDVVDTDGGSVVALEVTVLPRIVLTVAFHYAQNATIGTTRSLGEETAMIDTVNEIFNDQTNMEFTISQSRQVTVTESFGSEVNEAHVMPSGKTEWETITAYGNPGARVNVIFVKEIEMAEDEAVGGDDSDALGSIGGINVVFEDEAGTDEAESLAHEIGHNMGCRHNSPIRSTQEMLMWDTTDERGRFIPRAHVQRMRSTFFG